MSGVGQKELFKCLSKSYQDILAHGIQGSLVGYDGCRCGRNGKFFKYMKAPSVEPEVVAIPMNDALSHMQMLTEESSFNDFVIKTS